jgi:hypothetical protein
MTIIGTVKILRDRTYPDHDKGGDVCVLAGIYPVLLDSGLTFWRMEGKKSKRRQEVEFVNLESDPESSLFLAYPPGDYVSDEIASVDSHKFTESEFREFLLTDPACSEGPEKRLEFALFSSDPRPGL